VVDVMEQSKRRRRRGVILTTTGLQKFQAAKIEAEINERRYTLETLSERTGISIDTLAKVLACESGVDKQTLKLCFNSFGLTLEPEDYYLPVPTSGLSQTLESLPSASASPGPSAKLSSELPLIAPPLFKPALLELPEGQVPLYSPLYIERPPIEPNCYQTIAQPGALIRIKAPRQMGKSSLLIRILDRATDLGCRSVALSFQLADKAIFQNLDQFLRWFCANMGLGLELPNRVTDYWDELFGSKVSCKMYFEQYLLAKTPQQVVLGLDDVDWLFQYPQLASDFFGLLRTWHEEAKHRLIWQKLRLVVVHSVDVLLPLNVNQSPFNVGLPVELPPLTPLQVADLAKRHGLGLSSVEPLLNLVGGQPYLIRLALYDLQQMINASGHTQDDVTEQIIENISEYQLLQWQSTAPASIYREHLQKKLWQLQQEPALLEAFQKVVNHSSPIELELSQAFKLQSMGLVYMQRNQVIATCALYRQFLHTHLN
jgi:transcriptional regulator with XRE-family HTH domain